MISFGVGSWMMVASKHNIDTAVFTELVDISGRIVLDVGSGSGGFVAWLNQNGATAYGVECSWPMLDQARELFVDHCQVAGLGQRLPFASDSVSVVTFMNALHHIPPRHMVTALIEAARVAGPEGYVYVLEPVADGPGYEVSKLIDDEAEVRAQAQRAMDRLAGVTLIPENEGRYINRFTYAGVEDYLAVMVGVDQNRADAIERHREQVAEAFRRHGTPTRAGTAFDHPMHYRLFGVGGD
jgi:SAM-dependent methyltransferase